MGFIYAHKESPWCAGRDLSPDLESDNLNSLVPAETWLVIRILFPLGDFATVYVTPSRSHQESSHGCHTHSYSDSSYVSSCRCPWYSCKHWRWTPSSPKMCGLQRRREPQQENQGQRLSFSATTSTSPYPVRSKVAQSNQNSEIISPPISSYQLLN